MESINAYLFIQPLTLYFFLLKRKKEDYSELYTILVIRAFKRRNQVTERRSIHVEKVIAKVGYSSAKENQI